MKLEAGKMKEYDFVFVIPAQTIFGYPPGGINIFYRLACHLAANRQNVAIISVRYKYKIPERFVTDRNRASNINTNPDLPKLATFAIDKASKIAFTNLALLKFFQIALGNDYDYTTLDNVDMIFKDENDYSGVKTKRIFAGAWPTAYYVSSFIKNNHETEGFYIIQNFEDNPLFSGKSFIYAKQSYKLKELKKIVICDGLKKKFVGDEPLQFHVGVDENLFKPKTKIGERNPYTVMFSLRVDPSKGSKYLLKAIHVLKKSSDKYRFIATGNVPPRSVPKFIEYHYKPSNKVLVELYNSASIFIYTSVVEGFGSPPLEAMACGCLTITTDCVGVHEYAKDGFNCILVPIRNSTSIVEAVRSITTRPIPYKRLLSKNGIATAKRFTYSMMNDSFSSLFR